MTLGKKIAVSRKSKKMTGEALALAVGTAPSTISKIENDLIKPSDETLIKISDALDDRLILLYALFASPICQRIIPRAFEPLNNINDNPSAILNKLREEMSEAIKAADILARIFSVKEPENSPCYKETLFAKLEQIIDVPRCVEELFARLKGCRALTEEEHLEIHIRQQAKVERNGHHKPDHREAI